MFDYEVNYRTEKSQDIKHKVNEDYYMHTQIRVLNDEIIDVLVLADGMGGLEQGDKASFCVVNEFLYAFYKEIISAYQPKVKNFSITHYTKCLQDAVIEGITQANRKVCEIADVQIGTTISVVVILGNYAVIANIGDSPIYYYDSAEQELVLLSQLQTQAQRSVQAGEYSVDSEEYYTDSNILTDYIGMYQELPKENIAIQIIEKLSIGDVFLLCSDGAVGRLNCEILQKILCQMDGKEALKEIFKQARIDKNDDQTAILYKICEED